MCGKMVLAVSLNSAWQKTLNFASVEPGAVNRSYECHEAGGGKGVNVARVFRLLGEPVAVTAFVGGYTGECLRHEFSESGIRDLSVSCQGATRCCYTVIDHGKGEATELIEPSAEIHPDEVSELMTMLARHMAEFSAVALCGSLPPGVPGDIYAQIAALAGECGVPVVLDAVKNVPAVLAQGVRLLKINLSELRQITGCDGMADGADALMRQFPKLEWLAVTNGADPAGIFNRMAGWRLTLPRLEKIVSPIGGGDCTTAIMTRHVAAGDASPEGMVEAFALALSCASASCLTDTPSVFDMAVARGMNPRVEKL